MRRRLAKLAVFAEDHYELIHASILVIFFLLFLLVADGGCTIQVDIHSTPTPAESVSEAK